MLKQINELKDGACVVVAKLGETERHFKGTYCEDLEMVFMTVSSAYEVIGYIQ